MIPRPANTVQLLTADGRFQPTEAAAEYLPYLERLDEDDYRRFLPRHGQGARVRPRGRQPAAAGAARPLGPEPRPGGAPRSAPRYAARPQDHVFPSYREHAVGMVRGIDPVDIVRDCCAASPTAAGTRPSPRQLPPLHARDRLADAARHGLRHGDRSSTARSAPATPTPDEAVIVYFGDGATSQGDVSEAFVFAASYQTPQVFFLQNNHWAISVPGRAPVAHAALSARRADSASRACRSTATTCSRATPSPRSTSTTHAPARARASSRPSPTGWARTPRATTPRKYRTDEEVAVLGGARPDPPLPRLPASSRGVGQALLRRRRRGGAPTSRPMSAAARSQLDGAAAGVDVRPRLQRAASAGRRAEAVARRLRGVVRRGRMSDSRHSTSHVGRDGPTPRRAVPRDGPRTAPRQGAERRPAPGAAGRPPSAAHGRGHRPARRRLPRDRGAAERVRRRSACSTPRSPSPASSAPRSAWRMRGFRPVCEIQFDGFIFPGVRPDHHAARQDDQPARGRAAACPSSSACRTAATSAPSSTTRRARRRTSRTPPACASSARRTPNDAYWMIQEAIASDDPVHLLRAEEPLLAEGRGRPRREPRSPLHASRVVRTRHRRRPLVGHGAMVSVAAPGRRARGRRGHAASRSSTCARSPRSTTARSSTRCARPAAWSSRRRRPAS